MIRRTAAAFALLGLVVLHAPDASAGLSEGHGLDLKISRLHIDVQVNGDGSFTETVDLIEQLHSERAVRDGGQIKIPYSSSLDDLQVVSAYTLKRDGRRIPVPAGSIFVQDGLISTEGVTSFQDVKTTVVVFPQLEPDDSIAITSRLWRKKPMLPGVFTYARSFTRDAVYDDVALTLTAPQSFPLSVQNVGLNAQVPVTAGGTTRWSWSFQNASVDWAEDDAVDPMMYRPRVLISSAKSYDELAALANTRFAGKALVSRTIQAAADDITRGAVSPMLQAAKIHEWVAKNIRYFAVVLDIGGIVPRFADEVLASRYGDCKDHAVLLQALLAAKGIKSYPALLNADSLFELPQTPVFGSFNHVIVYVPSLDVYLESNSPWVAFGTLPMQDTDKPVLLLGATPPQSRTPALSADRNQILTTTRIQVAADGSASGQDTIVARGAWAMYYGGWADSLAQTDPAKFARLVILNAGLAGEGTATAKRLSNANDFTFSLLYELKEYAPMEGAAGLRPVPPMDSLGSTARNEVSNPPTRKTPFTCVAHTDVSRIEISFPPGTQISVPKDVAADGPSRSYRVTYRQAGNTVHVERRYVSTVPHGYCAAEDYPAVRQLQAKILRDLHSEIRYVPAGGSR